MFGLGTAELIVILLVALIVLGPNEIPKVARTLGRGLRELQRAKDDLKKNIEFDEDDIKLDNMLETDNKNTNKDEGEKS